jgi:enoyl-CoA hydratase/carnithine racemase
MAQFNVHMTQLEALLQAVDNDDTIGCIVLTGGDNAFCGRWKCVEIVTESYALDVRFYIPFDFQPVLIYACWHVVLNRNHRFQ